MKLKPCPFCGHEAEILGSRCTYASVECTWCEAGLSVHSDYKPDRRLGYVKTIEKQNKAAKAVEQKCARRWNKRVS